MWSATGQFFKVQFDSIYTPWTTGIWHTNGPGNIVIAPPVFGLIKRLICRVDDHFVVFAKSPIVPPTSYFCMQEIDFPRVALAIHKDTSPRWCVLQSEPRGIYVDAPIGILEGGASDVSIYNLMLVPAQAFKWYPRKSKSKFGGEIMIVSEFYN